MSDPVAASAAATADNPGSGLTQAHYDWASQFCGVSIAPAPNGGSAADDGADGGSAAKLKTDPKLAKAQDTATKVNGMSDADVAKLSGADQVALLKDLEGSGKTTGDLRVAQIKIFRNMKLESGFKARESARADKVADEVKDDADVKASANDWAGSSKDQKVRAMQRILTAQCKQLGLPAPPLLAYDKAPKNGNVEDGFYNPKDGKLHFNTNPGANKTFNDAMDTVVHEMSHAYQHDLVKRLKDGTLKAGDPDYAQAQMFEANDSDDDYIQPDEDMAAYVAQPEENHARIVAADYIDKIQKKLSGPAPPAHSP
jgi:hypothetical protein